MQALPGIKSKIDISHADMDPTIAEISPLILESTQLADEVFSTKSLMKRILLSVVPRSQMRDNLRGWSVILQMHDALSDPRQLCLGGTGLPRRQREAISYAIEPDTVDSLS